MTAVDPHSPSAVGPAATLRDALEAWRADRSSTALADRVDEVSAHVERLAAPPKIHPWWTEHARSYDPVIATTLLATLHVQARGSNVPWRTIIQRDTPLVAELRAHGLGAPDALGRGDWLNLVDRVGLMLSWPDDPRVAIALAELIRHEAFFDDGYFGRRHQRHESARACIAAIAKRVSEIGDLRALERVASMWKQLDRTSQQGIVDAARRAPLPRTSHDFKVAGAWQAVLDEPHELAPRLVLADAFMEQGDPRGELIALQCAPLVAIEKARAAGETIDAHGLFGVGASRIAELIQTNWHRWLGDVGLVVSRSSRFRAGLLSEAYVGHAATPPWAWQRLVDHRELCALHRLVPSREVDRGVFADFVLALARMPRWLHFDVETLDAVRARTRTLHVPGVSLNLFGRARALPTIFDDVLALSPELERLDLAYVDEYDLAAVRALAYRLPGVRLQFTVHWTPTHDDRAIISELQALPHVQISSYGDDL